MSFLGDLAGAISSGFSVGENNNRTLDAVVNGQDVKYGRLGDFASKIDQSAQRRYVEEGYLRTDPYSADPKQLEVLFQEPNATVLLKKRMFSSIAENYRPDFMDQDEKLYYRAMKILFQNKCNVISALEKLSKIHQIVTGSGSLSDQLFPIIATLSDTIKANSAIGIENDLFSGFGGGLFGGSSDPTALGNAIDKARRLYGFNATNTTTTWITDSTNLFQSQLGQGTGTIEITNFTSLTTNTSVDSIRSPGTFNISIVDPYEAMLITDWDIEKAIADATNMWSGHSAFNFAQNGIDQTIQDQQSRLNGFRSSRGASPISLHINPETLLGRRVTAILDRLGIELVFDYNSGFGGLGGGATVSAPYLKGGSIAGNDGLDTANGVDASGIRHPVSENSVFSDLVSSIYSKIQLNANSQNAFQLSNKNTNYARRKLRFNFSGHVIIQPMDVVHIYINTKSRYDTKLLSGLQDMFAGGSVLQNLGNMAINIANAASTLFNPGGNADVRAEKAAYVGPDFPNYLWSILRSQFVNENEGTHVFAGVVQTARDNWSDGKFTIDVSGQDNTFYFDQGKVNFKPGIDVFNGAAYDPLTPFKSNFDTVSSNTSDNIPELLDENKIILGTSQSRNGLIKSKSGPTAGQKIYSDTLFSGTLINKNTGQQSKEIFAPDGLVYRWKEGIGTFAQKGSSLSMNDPNTVGSPSIATDPFAGQDIMNVISLLVTGQPYNYSNYWRANKNIDGFGNDPQIKENASYSYTASLKSSLVKNNTLWGNFIPFKNLVIDEQSFALAMQSQFRIKQIGTALDDKIQKLAKLNAFATTIGAVNAFASPSSTVPGGATNPQYLDLQSQIRQLQSSINADISNLQLEDKTFNALSVSAGPDATFDFSGSISSNMSPSANSNRKSLRRQMNTLTRRMSYNVRSNEDKNLFIVDDTYDKDNDIMAYNQGLDRLKLWNNEFLSTKEKIAATASLLNLEVFADTQGHIRVRSPQYNNMPSSVFYKMMYLKQAYGIQTFPQFLSDFFGNQINTLKQAIELLEDLIRLDCAVLGQTTDDTATSLINNSGIPSNTGSSFGFISSPSGIISDISSAINAADGDFAQSQAQQFLSTLQSNSGTKNTFNNTARYTVIVDSLTSAAQKQSGINTDTFTVDQSTYIQSLINRIQTKSGGTVQVNKTDYIVDNSNGIKDVSVPSNQAIDVFKATSELQQKIQERQKAIKLFYSVIKNAAEAKSLDQDNSSNSLSPPPSYNNSNVPEVFEHMIEDETYDDYGPGSGTRFIIKRSQIRNIQISAGEPDFNVIEVQGTFNTYNPNDLPEGFTGAFAGNSLVSAIAVDYDSWRTYGLKSGIPINVPFLSDPVSQLAPYASMILSRNRKNVIKGTVTISGNEYMQPGEVVYLQDRGQLFYVTSVQHNFGFGNSFATTLQLSYGHTPGEYIPTPMDVIGKLVYNNRDIASYTIQRQANSGNEISLGAVLLDAGGSNTLSTSGDTPTSSFSAFNNQIINNILFTTAYMINANSSKGNNITASIELRVYSDNNTPTSSTLSSFAGDVRSVLLGVGSSGSKSPALPSGSVSIRSVSLDDDTDRRSPSQKAIDAARNQAASTSITISTSSLPTSSQDSIRKALFGYIVDCWLIFERST